MKDILSQLIYKTNLGRFDAIWDRLQKDDVPCMVQSSNHAANIIAFPYNLTNPDCIVFTAHYDIVSGSCGANDNGAAVSILVQLAQTLRQTEHNETISIVFLDKEEYGGYGCELFLSNYEPKLMINMDMCGCGDKIVVLDEISTSNPYEKYMHDHTPDDVVWTDTMPYCDSRHAWTMGIDVWTITLFPENDAIKMGNVRMNEKDKLHIKNRDLAPRYLVSILSHNSSPRNMEISAYMHKGPKDFPQYLNTQMMQKIYDYVEDVALGTIGEKDKL